MGNAEPTSWVKDLWDILKSKASIRPMIALGILSALALFLPPCWLAKMGVAVWVKSYWAWIVVAFGLCSLMLPIHLIEWAAKPIVEAHQISKRFNDMTSDEKQLLQRFIDADVSTLQLWAHEAGVGPLLADGIIFCASLKDVWGDSLFAYSLTPAARRQIAKNRKFTDRRTARSNA